MRRDANGVKLSVFYDPRHAFNVDRMLAALKSSLSYYQANFGPYQFDHARVIEFPGYATFAQAFAGTMPYSESIGFLANNTDPEKIDSLIRKLVRGKLNDGQLDNSTLTFSDLDKICGAFSTVLTGVFHERIEYPDVTIPARTDKPEPQPVSEKPAEAAPAAAKPAEVPAAAPVEAAPVSAPERPIIAPGAPVPPIQPESVPKGASEND